MKKNQITIAALALLALIFAGLAFDAIKVNWDTIPKIEGYQNTLKSMLDKIDELKNEHTKQATSYKKDIEILNKKVANTEFKFTRHERMINEITATLSSGDPVKIKILLIEAGLSQKQLQQIGKALQQE